MKRQWSEDRNTIIEELTLLAAQETPLVLARPGEVPATITARHILGDSPGQLVEIVKTPGMVLDQAEPYYVFYQRHRQALLRGFSLRFVRQSNRFARAPLPLEIFEIQRRKFPRVFTPRPSILTCVPKNSRRLFTAQILDISLEGARIFGDMEGLGLGSVLTPLTLTLYFRDSRQAPLSINVTEAVVVREVRIKEKVEISFHFDRADADQRLLAQYMELRGQEPDLILDPPA
jgi:hypothetical protein